MEGSVGSGRLERAGSGVRSRSSPAAKTQRPRDPPDARRPTTRRLEDGDVAQSTCCNNTASEHAMMRRLMVDDAVHWAVDYRVAGFRFDVMGHHMLDDV